MKTKFKSLMLALLSSASFFAMAGSTGLMTITIVNNPQVTPDPKSYIELSNIRASGYFATKSCKSILQSAKAASIQCELVDPQAIGAGGLTADLSVDHEAPTEIHINKAQGSYRLTSDLVIGIKNDDWGCFLESSSIDLRYDQTLKAELTCL